MGLEATFHSPTSGYTSQSFGQMDDGSFTCVTHDMSAEELMWLTLYSDPDDVEGIVWEGNLGSTWTSRANGNLASPRMQMMGRPIGFRVWSGDGGTDN